MKKIDISGSNEEVVNKLRNLLHCLKGKIIDVEISNNRIVINLEKLSDEFTDIDKNGFPRYKEHYGLNEF